MVPSQRSSKHRCTTKPCGIAKHELRRRIPRHRFRDTQEQLQQLLLRHMPSAAVGRQHCHTPTRSSSIVTHMHNTHCTSMVRILHKQPLHLLVQHMPLAAVGQQHCHTPTRSSSSSSSSSSSIVTHMHNTICICNNTRMVGIINKHRTLLITNRNNGINSNNNTLSHTHTHRTIRTCNRTNMVLAD
ncbi:hypothetical protein CYMTET_48077 [Cymbomonas tetramitiformis]|uniref:Uncharacterized protein n=1 Tax=Cymbomonas tetramitiformis TaxID=36881 RepID=A0AAE0BU94_9CHLO|nr:hypothetical protein CYMTET_48077 [Cymbomonas tetramitiformis]